ncbi:hypothetical protein ES708_10968 [subsurface metagenome]
MVMRYEITENLRDDIVINNAIMKNMEEITNLRNTIEMQRKIIENLNVRLDALYILIIKGNKTVILESRV